MGEQKVKQLRSNLDRLKSFIDEYLVLAKARGLWTPKPLPTQNMLHRSHEAYSRCLNADSCHTVVLLNFIEQLRARSSPDRLPTLAEELSDACAQLQEEISSEQFLVCVGENVRGQFPQRAETRTP